MNPHRRVETNLRFVLVGLAVAGAVLVMAESLWYILYLDEANAVVRGCLPAGPGEPMLRCLLPMERGRVGWTLTATALVLALVAGCALAGSWARRRGLRELPPLPEGARSAFAPLADHSAEQGRDVAILRRPERPTAAARADGVRRHYVEVGTNWMAWALTDPDRARAVLRHELAHHRARDVLPTRLSWWSGPVLAAAAVVFVALELTLRPATLVGAVTRVALVVLAVLLARAAALRIREHDADLVAAALDPGSLRRALGPGAAVGPRRRWTPRALRTHPSAADRLRQLAGPDPTGAPPVGDAVVVGLVATIAGPTLSRLSRSWFAVGDLAYWSELAGWGLAGGLVGAWVVVVLSRATDTDPGTGRPLRVRRFAWTLAGSLLAGSLVLDQPLAIAAPPPTDLLSIVVLLGALLVLVGVVRWLRDLVALRRGAADRFARPVALAAGATVFALALGVVGSLLSVVRALSDAGAPGVVAVPALLALLITTFLASGPVLVVVLVATAATVVLAVRARAAGGVRACVVGAAAGVLATAGLALVAGGTPSPGAGGPVDTAAAAATVLWGTVLPPVACGGMVAALVARRLRLVHAVVAAAVGSLVGAIGTLVVPATAGASFTDWLAMLLQVLVAVPVGLVLASLVAPVDRADPEAPSRSKAASSTGLAPSVRGTAG